MVLSIDPVLVVRAVAEYIATQGVHGAFTAPLHAIVAAQCALANVVTVSSVHPMGVKATLVVAILTSARMDRVPRH
jgi:hypothetical protein